ncbi:MAG: hypothetical protein AB1797_05080 [bacterium]
MKKRVGYLMVLWMIWATPVYADLTKQDIEEIRQIVKDEVQSLREEMNTRIDDLKQEMNTRIDDVNTRIDDVNTRIDGLQDLLYVILAGMFALVGFVIWDRRTALAPAVKKAKELEEREERLEKALKEYALQEPRLAGVLRQVGIL